MAYAASSEVRRPTGVSGIGGVNAKFLVAGGVMALAVAYLVITGIQSAAVYSLTVAELTAKGAAAQTQVFRVSGNLVPGSLVRDPANLNVSFQIADPDGGSGPLRVVYHGGQVPDIIGDNIQMVVEGKENAQGTFQANTVLAKCPSRLENAPPDEHDYSQAGA